jgi:peptidoglycan/xylan/chitin deacetylase (PgdA/CDA1 family)
MSPSLDRGIFTLSLDFELVWGSRDLYADPALLIRQALITRERIFDRLLSLLTTHGIIATWATVGHLFLHSASRQNGLLHPSLTPPQHSWRAAPWLEGVPEGSEIEHPAWYGRSLLLQLKAAGQDIGSHSFSHAIFGDPGCSRECAESEIARCVSAAADLGIELRSFVFPRNQIGHVDLLGKYGFTCWRSRAPVWYRDKRIPGIIQRAAHLAAVGAAVSPVTVMPHRDPYGLWCIPASGSFLPTNGVRRFIPVRQRVRRAIHGINAAAAERRISHFWLHPINLVDRPKRLLDAMAQIIEHAARLRDQGQVEILSMAEIAEQAAARG